MKLAFLIILTLNFSFLSISQTNMSDSLSIQALPNSPNYVSTKATKKARYMDPLTFTGDPLTAAQKLEFILATYSQAVLVERRQGYLHFEFTTKIGNFIDDVIFIVDEDSKEIHFSSSSRTGHGDFGKNKRRMKRIQKDWIFFD